MKYNSLLYNNIEWHKKQWIFIFAERRCGKYKKRIEKQFLFGQQDCMTVLISGFEKCTVNWRGGWMEKSLIKSISRFRPKWYRKGLWSFGGMTNFRLKTETGHSVQVTKAKTPLIDFYLGGAKYSCSQRREQLCIILTNRNSCSILSKLYFYIKLKELFLWRKS